MTKHLHAVEVLNSGYPPDEGKRLALHLLKQPDVDWENLLIDLHKLPVELLISPFFNAFLQTVHDERPELLDKARAVRWDAEFDFQDENIRSWMTEFHPFENAAEA
jgi:hypothetical protein